MRLRGWLTISLLLGTMAYAIAEDITLTTYYPSPRGVYKELRVQDLTVMGTFSGNPTFTDLTLSGDFIVQGNTTLGDAATDLITLNGTIATYLSLGSGSSPDGGLIAKGTRAGGQVLPVSGTGTRLMWYPRKAALRAGTVMGGSQTQWDDANIGYESVAFGVDAMASGNQSTVTGGTSNTASAVYAVVGGGQSNTASGAIATISGGEGNVASGSRATVSGGGGNVAAGDYSWAGGRGMVIDSAAVHTFAWGYSTPTMPSITAPDSFIIFPTCATCTAGNVGIGVLAPQEALHIDPGNLKVAGGGSFGDNIVVNGGLVWHAANDGTGSGLDADTLDGIPYFFRVINPPTGPPQLCFTQTAAASCGTETQTCTASVDIGRQLSGVCKGDAYCDARCNTVYASVCSLKTCDGNTVTGCSGGTTNCSNGSISGSSECAGPNTYCTCYLENSTYTQETSDLDAGTYCANLVKQ